MKFKETPHRRLNVLTGEWVQVSPHRMQRPWQGQHETVDTLARPDYDPGCYLCPGNTRAGGKLNPKYESTFVFDNDFSALLPDIEKGEFNQSDLLVAHTEKGLCKVICFSPDHGSTLPEMSVDQIRKVVDVWTEQYKEIGDLPYINYVQIFENKGEAMGCSNPHPHGQIWAQESLPNEVRKELDRQTSWYKEHGRTLLVDYLKLELESGERVVLENDDFVVVVPFWAVWPFETLVISRRAFGRFTDMTDQEKTSLAGIIRGLTIRYDNLFNVSFPYSAGFHPAPTDGKPHPEWHFHMHFYPPLLRSATVKKFMVGYELLGNAQRDITPEMVADMIRKLPDVHYKAMG